MLKRKITILIATFVLVVFAGCSGSGTGIPTAPSEINNSQLRQLDSDITIPVPEIEITESKDCIPATFFLDEENTFSGIEIRIDGELAGVTGEDGEFDLPPDIQDGTILEFAVDGEVFHKASLTPERHAQGPGGPVGEGNLYGVVTDENGGVPYALVIVTDGDKYAYDISNSQGVYNIMGAPTGHLMVIAVAELHHNKIGVVDLEPNQPVQLNIFLNIAQGLGKLYGRTFVPGVGLLKGVYVNFSQPSGVVREDISNIYGMYELLNIPAGLGHLYAHKNGFHDVNADLLLQPGFNGLDIGLVPINLGAVVGQVKTPDGYKIQGALVRLTYKNLQGNYQQKFSYTGSQGQFGFGEIPPGSYAVQSFAPGWYPDVAIGTVFEGTIEEKQLVMYQTEETGDIEGWAVDFDGSPVPYAWGYVTYIGFDSMFSGWTMADENGHFYVAEAPYGPYAIRVESAAFLPGWEFVDVVPNEDDDFLKICFPYNPDLTGILSGTVLDADSMAQPESIVRITAVGNPDVSFMTITDSIGSYNFPLLPPTVYNAVSLKTDVGYGTGFQEVFQGMESTLDILLTQ